MVKGQAAPVGGEFKLVGTTGDSGTLPPHGCEVENLVVFLQSIKLEKYRAEALRWCEEMGAAYLDEVWDQREQFADALKLKPLERMRLTGEKGAAALKESRAQLEGGDHEEDPKRKRVKVEKEVKDEKEQTMLIFFQNIKCKNGAGSYSVQVRFDEKVVEVKKIIEKQTGELPYKLSYSEGDGSFAKTLPTTSEEKPMRLSDLNFKSGMVIFYELPGFKIFCQSLNLSHPTSYKWFTIRNIKPSDTIKNVKWKINDQVGLNSQQPIRLFFDNGGFVKLKDDKRVADFNIQKGSKLQFMSD